MAINLWIRGRIISAHTDQLQRSSSGLRQLTSHTRKIVETANIKLTRGAVWDLQQIYGGRIPEELGQINQLRVGNNHALRELKNLRRIGLHQNNFQGMVSVSLH